MTLAPDITLETPEDVAAVAALVERAFGPGRYAKTAERLREGGSQDFSASVVARRGGEIVGCAQMWRVRIGQTPALLLGPFAVAEGERSRGLGHALVQAACEAAAKSGAALVVLVGDGAFFQRAGFSPVDPTAIRLPGPVDMGRVMIRALTPGAAEGLSGLITPA